MMMSKPKNLIILSSDEMRGDAPGYAGNPDCKTPNIDSLAAKGVAFDRHYTVFPKCVPARIAMMTGRYCHTDGYRTIFQHMPPDDPNLLKTLTDSGYETAVFGLNHVWQNFYGEGDKKNVKSGGCVDYHSFTTGYFRDHNDKEWPPGEAGPRRPLELPAHYRYGGRRTEPRTGHDDNNRADQAIDYLTTIRDRERPFYMQVNFSLPHPGYNVEEPWFSMYDPKTIKGWEFDLPQNAPLPLTRMRQIRTGLDDPEENFREIQATYYGMCSKVDWNIGRVLKAIETEGLFDNSVVLFWVDHGDFAGQYGLLEKWDTYMGDCLTRVPFVLWSPDQPSGIRIQALTDHTDIAPTLCELLGLDPFPGIQGKSLLPVIRGEWQRDAVFADGGHEDEMWTRFNFNRKNKDGSPREPDGKQLTYRDAPETMARAKMIRTDRWKLTIRLVGGNELYDMQNDPDEMKNLWPEVEGDPELQKVVCDLQTRLVEWCLETDTDRPYQDNVGA